MFGEKLVLSEYNSIIFDHFTWHVCVIDWGLLCLCLWEQGAGWWGRGDGTTLNMGSNGAPACHSWWCCRVALTVWRLAQGLGHKRRDRTRTHTNTHRRQNKGIHPPGRQTEGLKYTRMNTWWTEWLINTGYNHYPNDKVFCSVIVSPWPFKYIYNHRLHLISSFMHAFTVTESYYCHYRYWLII